MDKKLLNILKECEGDIKDGEFQIPVYTAIREDVDCDEFIFFLYKKHIIHTDPVEYFNTILLEFLLTDFSYIILSDITKDFSHFNLYDEINLLRIALHRFNIEVYLTPGKDYIIMDNSRIDLKDIVEPQPIDKFSRVNKGFDLL